LAGLNVVPAICSDSGLLLRHKQISLAFAGVKRIIPTGEQFIRLRRARMASRYWPALQMAELLVQHYRPANLAGEDHVLAILFDMNMLWQDYIFHRLLEAGGENVEVTKHNNRPFWKSPDGGRPAKIKPDIVLKWGDRTVVIDTTWKLLKHLRPT